MGPDQALYRNRWYYSIMAGIVIATGILGLIIRPFGMTIVDALVFIVVLQVSYQHRTESLDRFNGYGVARELNEIAQTPVASSKGGLVLSGLFVRALICGWVITFVTCLILVLMGITYAWAELASFPRVIVICVAGLLLACGFECCYWVIAGRHRHWYMPQSVFRERLRKYTAYSPFEIDEIVRKAKERGILHVNL